MPVEPAVEPTTRQSAAVSEWVVQAPALWGSLQRLASRSTREAPEPVNLAPVVTIESISPSEAVWPAFEPRMTVPELFQVSRLARVVTAGVVSAPEVTAPLMPPWPAASLPE